MIIFTYFFLYSVLVQEKILLDRAAWSEAANSDPEALNIDEFMTFRHPEHSHVSLINMVNDIINTLGMNLLILCIILLFMCKNNLVKCF